MRRFIFIVFFMAHFFTQLSAIGTIEVVNSTGGELQEGRTYTFRFRYVQTEGTDLTKDITSLSYNTVYSADVDVPLNASITFSFRNGYASMLVKRENEKEVSINGENYALALGSHHYNIVVRGETMRMWIDADTTGSPVATVDSIYLTEGKADIKTEGGTIKKNEKMHVDYAYGLQFMFLVPAGTAVPDVNKKLDQTSVVYYSRMTIPPMFYNSTPNEDGTILYCDFHPTAMNQPIPYGSVYTFEWEETVKSCADDVTNQVLVKLYGLDDDSLTFSQSFPCGENTCPIDTAYIVANTTCDNQSPVLLAKSNLPASDLVYSWNKNSLHFKDTETDSLVVDADGDYQVKVFDKDDETCNYTSPWFTLKRKETPVVSLPDSFVTEKSVTLQPAKKAVAGKYSYRWSTGDTTPSIVARNPGTYRVQVFNGNCEVDLATRVVFPFQMDFPVILSPNGDGVNDVFSSAYLRKNYPDATIKIFNRYGKQLAFYLASDEGWNGSYQGSQLPTDDYWFEAYIEQYNKYYTGHFTLMRQ